MSLYFYLAGAIAIGMLIWNTIEVGRNDATNVVNAVFGSRVLRRKTAVYLSGIAVIFGACAATPVMETARSGIFDPATIPVLEDCLSIYIAVYLTNTVLLYSFSAFGMPISTTACLVFALLGGGYAIGGAESVKWAKSQEVVLAILCSIFISGAAAFFIQRAFRGAMGRQCDDPEKVNLHGPWIGGLLLTGLVYFVLMKGMKNVDFVKFLRKATFDEFGAPLVLFSSWAVMASFVWLLLRIGGDAIRRKLFGGMAVLGMLATAFAFGQNDLANCASPGIAAWMIIKEKHLAYNSNVPLWFLLLCGCLLAMGMATRNAQRVTRAEVNTGSQGDVVRLYAPRWCVGLAKFLLPKQKTDALAPQPVLDESHRKLQHYDALRAAVITSISGSVIAFASGRGLPVSTTYVAFAAVIATGWADRIFARGDAVLKMGRTIWVVFCWFFSAFLSAVITGMGALVISRFYTIGILVLLAINLLVRYYMDQRANRQEEILQLEAAERKKAIYGELGEHHVIASEMDDEH
ncbi:MAG: inorganic phosphate transporter [Candidatus Omnitrophota bacterium]